MGLFTRHPWRTLYVALAIGVLGWGAHSLVQKHRANRLRTDAQVFAARDEFRTAADLLKSSLEINPDDPDTLFLMARTCRRADRLDEASAWLDAFERQNSEPGKARLERRLIRVQHGFVEEMTPEVKGALDKDASANPFDLLSREEKDLIYEALCRTLLARLRTTEAEFFLEKWHAFEPDRLRALVGLAVVNVSQDKMALARGYVDRALELNPDHAEALEVLGVIHLRSAEPRECVAILEPLAKRDSGNPLLHLNLAEAYLDSGNHEEAERILSQLKASNASPNFVSLRISFLRAKVAMQQQRYELAERFLTEYLRYNKNDSEAMHAIVEALRLQGKSEAVTAWKTKLTWVEARMSEVRVLRKKEANPEVSCDLAQVHLQLGHVDEAIFWLHFALKQNPHHERSLRTLADHFRSIGQESRAREYEKKLNSTP